MKRKTKKRETLFDIVWSSKELQLAKDRFVERIEKHFSEGDEKAAAMDVLDFAANAYIIGLVEGRDAMKAIYAIKEKGAKRCKA